MSVATVKNLPGIASRATECAGELLKKSLRIIFTDSLKTRSDLVAGYGDVKYHPL